MFEWDEGKRQATIAKHGIDFVDAAEVLNGQHVEMPGSSDVETRLIAVGMFGDLPIAVVFTMRQGKYRIITARRARRNERRRYQELYSGRDPEDEKPN